MSAKSTGSKSFKKEKNTEVLSVLKDHIKNKQPARVYLFHGEERFLIDYYVGELKKLVLENDNGLNLSIFENKVDIRDLIDACDTFPAFSDRKLVLVKNSGLFHNKVKKEAPAAVDEGDEKVVENTETDSSSEVGNKAQEALKTYIPEIPETTCLIFIETQVDKRLGAYKQIAKYGLAAEFNRLGISELIPWVIKGVRQSGKAITEEAAQHLVDMSEPDMYSLKNEIMKLCAYAGERKEISLGDVRLMATPTIKSIIFDLLDAVARKDAPRALQLLTDMLVLKEPEQKILSMLSKQTGELLKLKTLLRKGASQLQIGQYFQGKHPYALKMLMGQAQSMDEKYLKELLKGCMEAEVRYKKGLMDSKLSLEVLLGKINS